MQARHVEGRLQLTRGKKVILRAVEEHDLPLLTEWLNDPDIAQMVGGWTFPTSLSQQKVWLDAANKDTLTQRWIIETDDRDPIGLTGLWNINWHDRLALTAIKLSGSDDVRGKGYGTDAVFTLMAYAFAQVGLNRLWSEIIEYNTPSYHLYVRACGWKVEGLLRQSVFRNNEFHDQLRVAILKDEFLALPRAREYLSSQGTQPETVCPARSEIALPNPWLLAE